MKGCLYIICGDDDYLINSEAEECIKKHVSKQNREFCLEVIYGSVTTGGAAKVCADNVIQSIQTQSFFGGDKVTWLRDAVFLPGAGRVSEYEESKEAADKLTEVITAELQEGQILVITTPKLRKNSTFYKTCAPLGKLEDFGSGQKSWELDKTAMQRLDNFIEKAGIKIGQAARKEFLQRAGYDTRTIVSELEKLVTYVGDKKEADVADVREIVSVGREAEAWDVVEAFGSRNGAALVESVERLSGQKGVAIMLSAMIDRNIRDMLVLREAYDRKWLLSGGIWSRNIPVEADMLLKSLPGNYRTMGNWILKNKLSHALNYTQQELRVARYRLIELRENLVSTGQPEMFLLQTALLRVMARKSKPAGSGARRKL